jgi:hypothetical protein
VEHAVIVTVNLSGSWFGRSKNRKAAFALGEQLEEALAGRPDCEFDGDEFGGGECTYYMYGTDADALFALVEPVLRAPPITRGGRAVKRFGDVTDPAAREERVDL